MNAQYRKAFATFKRANDFLSQPGHLPFRVVVSSAFPDKESFPEGEFIVAKITPETPSEVENGLLALQTDVPIVVIRQTQSDHALNSFSGDMISCRTQYAFNNLIVS